MKLNTLFVLAVCTGTLMSSCVFKTAEENQFRYTHTSLVDGDAFAVLQHVNETAVNAVKLAEVAAQDAEMQNTSARLKDFYGQFIVSLDSISNRFDVILNPVPSPEMNVSLEVDSLGEEIVSTAVDLNFNHKAQEDVLFVKSQLERLLRNTNKDLQVFANQQLTKANVLYSEVWGDEIASN